MSRKAHVQLTPEPTKKYDEIKTELCNVIQQVARRRQWRGYELALYAGCARTTICYVENKNIDRLTIGQLFKYLARIEPGFKMLIAIR